MGELLKYGESGMGHQLLSVVWHVELVSHSGERDL